MPMNPSLYNTPTTEEELLAWSSYHQQDHILIQYTIFQKYSGTSVILMPIDPVPVQLDMLTWTMNHQTMHNEMDNVTGVQGFDLSSVNFQQRDQLLIWINLHAWEHYRVWNVLDNVQAGQELQTPSPEAGLFATPTTPPTIPVLGSR